MPLYRLVVLAGCGVLAAISAVAVLAYSPPVATADSHHPFVTSVYLDRPEDVGPGSNVVFQHVVASGATMVRITLYWYQVAPTTLPTHWNPANPADPHYDWSKYDAEIREAKAHHLGVLLTMMAAPSWAQTSPAAPPLASHLPSPSDFAAFATAAARRYSGSFDGLPRVRYWQAWNEPNISSYLSPQLVNRKPVAVYNYRKLLNAFYGAVKAVRPDNVVIAAGLAPFRDLTPSVMAQNKDWGPLAFMRDLLCIGKNLKPTCSTKVSFDDWAQHPYTSGGPTHHAELPNDVSLPDLPKVQALIDAAVAAGHVRSAGKPGMWVTEFSWDTTPPATGAVPPKLAARWVAQTQYVLWRDGVTEFTWLMLRDDASPSFLQAGLYYRGATVAQDRPKPLFESFRFPVVAFKKGVKVDVWGRTPAGRREPVTLQQLVHGSWQDVAQVEPDRYGVFQTVLTRVSGMWIRGRLSTGESSNGFSLRNVPDHWYNPFGSTSALEPLPTSKPKPAKGK